MARQYISPESLTPAEVRQVLDFLNGAQSAEEIGAGIEIPGELDIGIRLGQRLLDMRAELGGEFTGIQQVADTPYIGPERFSEIVSVLTGRQLPMDTASNDQVAALQSELYELRRLLHGLQRGMGSHYSVSMRLAGNGIFLGQTAIILIEVRDSLTNKLRPNVPLTIATSWGTLETNVGFEKRKANVVTAYTDIHGKLTVKLIGNTFEKLTDSQQLALESVLRNLNQSANSPAAISDGVHYLVDQYKQPGNTELRKAIDIYFNHRRNELVDPINPPVSDFAWPYFNTIITAYIHEETNIEKQSATVESTTILKLKIKDWLQQWYQTYLDISVAASSLNTDFKKLTETITDKGVLVDTMLGSLGSYLATEPGLAAGIVAEKAAQRNINHFLATDVSSLPFDINDTLFSTLNVATKHLNVSQIGALNVISNVRRDVDNTLSTTMGRIGDVDALVGKIEGVKADISNFEDSYGEFSDKYTTFNSNYTSFSTHYTDFSTKYADFNTKNTTFNNNLTVFNTKYDDFQNKYPTFTSNYDNFSVRYSDFSTKYDNFNTRNTAFNSNLATFNRNLDSFNANLAGFNNNLSSFNNNIQTFNNNYATFNTKYSRFNNNLGTLNLPGLNLDIDPTE